jgi:type II secretory pathway component PulK
VSQNSSGSDALYVAWKIEPDDEIGARRVSLQLRRGEDRNLYRLRSWVIAGGEARALLDPAAPLERIAEAIWEHPANAIVAQWIASADVITRLAREIETAPVSMGLAKRPEQWPFSSAAHE